MARGFALLAAASAIGGVAFALAYGSRDGLLMALFMLVCGAPAIAGAHLLARRRAAAGSLARQLTTGTVAAVAPAMLGVGAIGALMFVSAHDAFTLGVLLVLAALLTAYSAAVLARGVMRDIETVRDGLRAVGEGRRDVDIVTDARDEVAELAAAANLMAGQLAEREAERDMAEKARRDLVAAVSHDLRTPLTSLRLLSEAVEDELVDPETRRRYLAQMSVHMRSLSALIDDLFELSRLEAGDIEWSMQQVALDELVCETVEAMRPHAERKMVVVRAEVNGSVAPAQANPEKLQRVLFNLIQNAIRHTPADGSVTVCAESNSTSVEVEVADSGEGVLKEERDRIFEPFFRGGEGKSRTGEGTGLGLTICRAIVEAHGGRIWLADSEAGTRVRFSLPLAG